MVKQGAESSMVLSILKQALDFVSCIGLSECKAMVSFCLEMAKSEPDPSCWFKLAIDSCQGQDTQEIKSQCYYELAQYYLECDPTNATRIVREMEIQQVKDYRVPFLKAKLARLNNEPITHLVDC